jgi:hypothetical protein
MVGRIESIASAGVDGSFLTALPVTESLSAIDTSSACEVTDWLLVLPRIELPIADDATLPPRPRLERPARTADSGAGPVAGCLPARVGLLAITSGGGDLEGSLRGLTLRSLGLFGDDFRFFVALAGNFIGVHRVAGSALEGVDTIGCIRTPGIGVESILAMSKGLKPGRCWLKGPGVALPIGGCPGSAENAGRAKVWPIGCPIGGCGLDVIGV